MQIGPYTLCESVGTGPAGFRFAATADGRAWEVRLLTQAKTDPEAWAGVTRNLRFLTLLDHPAALRPQSAEVDHDPPYLAVESTTPFEPTPDETLDAAEQVTSLLAEAHRLGWTLGPSVSFTPLRTATGRITFDLTGTAAENRGPADDITRLGALLRRWFPTDAIAQAMMSSNPAERPTADEVARHFARIPSQVAVSSVALDVTAVSEIAADVPDEIDPPAEVGLRPGDRVGRFVLREQLGEGGMGTVFKADDPLDGTTVAVKVLRPTVASNEAARKRFVKEARLAAAVNTPFVTRLIEANTDGERSYLALEFVAGESVGRAIKRGDRFDERTALGLIADAARGVAAAHAVGIVHRDLKPDNLLLTGAATGPKVKVTDFGLARQLVQSESMEITRAGATLGTPLYMPPEQFGSGPIDARADVYSLAAILFHLLAGRPPFPGDTLYAVAKAVANDPPPALDRINPDVSAATAALVSRCLAKNPADRPPDAAALVRELSRILDGESSDATAHPRPPAVSPTTREFVFTWNLRSSPAKLWPHVSNTERLNKATGLPAVWYETRKDENGAVRRFAHARVIGFDMTWEEHPFEWVEGRRMGILREFARGPFEWFLSVVELSPNGTGGTALKHTLTVQPRGLLGRMAAPVQIGGKAGKQLDRVYRRMDDVLTASTPDGPHFDAFEPPASRRGAQLQAGISRLRATKADPLAVTILADVLGTAPDQEVAHIRPFAVARRFKVNDAAMADVCLRAVTVGLLELGWDVICPLCRLASVRRDTLRNLKDHEGCEACDATFQPDFAQSVELVFRVHPDVRPAEVGRYCAGGPAHSPHVVAQTRLAAGERLELELPLTPGRYRLRGPQLPWSLDIPVTDGGAVRRWEVSLAGADRPPVPPLAAGGQVLVLTNDLPHPTQVRVERTAGRDDALTAAHAATLPAFRELFPDEVLSPGQLATASTVTLLHIGIDDADGWFEAVGEAAAFQHLQAALQRIEEAVRTEGGAVVKTVGETVLAAFDRTGAAVSVARRLVESESAGGVKWNASVHRGLVRMATVNDRLDYFGTTAKQAARLFDAASGGQVLLGEAVTADADVVGSLRGRPVRLIEIPTAAGPLRAAVIS
jgi:serine/threonine protein kinase/class 3 adenylate cyclase